MLSHGHLEAARISYHLRSHPPSAGVPIAGIGDHGPCNAKADVAGMMARYIRWHIPPAVANWQKNAGGACTVFLAPISALRGREQ
jgi:hypothetical protein